MKVENVICLTAVYDPSIPVTYYKYLIVIELIISLNQNIIYHL